MRKLLPSSKNQFLLHIPQSTEDQNFKFAPGNPIDFGSEVTQKPWACILQIQKRTTIKKTKTNYFSIYFTLYRQQLLTQNLLQS